jgi:single-strand DNA-binding protein
MFNAYGFARLGGDAELRYTSQGDAMANLSLAFSHGRRDPNTGERPTQWVDASIWGRRAEALVPMLLKGTAVMVSLEDLHVETYTRRDGTQGTKLAARVTDIEFASPPPARPDDGQSQRQAPARRPAPPAAARATPPERPAVPPAAPPAAAPAAAAPGGASGFDDREDDVPY